MGDTPTTDNTVAQALNKIIHAAVFDVGIAAAKAALVVAAPWCGWPVISQIIDLLLSTFGGYVYSALGDLSTFIVIDVQTDVQIAAYKDAIDSLHAVTDQAVEQLDQAKTQEQIDAAKEKWKEAFRKLAHSDGWAHP